MKGEKLKKRPTELNISMLRDGAFTHLLRLCLVGDDFYVHFISRDPRKLQTWGKDGLTEMHWPDHISYHRDGRVHVKHKKGKYSSIPLQLPEKFLSIDAVLDLPLLSISFFEQAFSRMGVRIGKALDVEPMDHVIIESCNTTFTVVVHIRDYSPKPKERRCIDLEIMPGGLAPNLQDRLVLQGKEALPFLLCSLNPTKEHHIKELRFFDEGEGERCKQFMARASRRFGVSKKVQ